MQAPHPMHVGSWDGAPHRPAAERLKKCHVQWKEGRVWGLSRQRAGLWREAASLHGSTSASRLGSPALNLFKGLREFSRTEQY